MWVVKFRYVYSADAGFYSFMYWRQIIPLLSQLREKWVKSDQLLKATSIQWLLKTIHLI